MVSLRRSIGRTYVVEINKSCGVGEGGNSLVGEGGNVVMRRVLAPRCYAGGVVIGAREFLVVLL